MKLPLLLLLASFGAFGQKQITSGKTEVVLKEIVWNVGERAAVAPGLLVLSQSVTNDEWVHLGGQASYKYTYRPVETNALLASWMKDLSIEQWESSIPTNHVLWNTNGEIVAKWKPGGDIELETNKLIEAWSRLRLCAKLEKLPFSERTWIKTQDISEEPMPDLAVKVDHQKDAITGRVTDAYKAASTNDLIEAWEKLGLCFKARSVLGLTNFWATNNTIVTNSIVQYNLSYTNNTPVWGTNTIPSDGTIRALGKSGVICRVLGHRWIYDIWMLPPVPPIPPARTRTCKICGLVQTNQPPQPEEWR